MSPIIQTINICKSYQVGPEPIEVLHNACIAVEKGDYCSIMGPSGSGKSTILHILGCLDQPTSGTFLFEGANVCTMDVTERARLRNRRLGFVFQNFNLLSNYTLVDNVAMPLVYCQVPPKERRQRAQHMLEQLGLKDRGHHRPSEVSGGQKQRAAIARALVTEPALILADEPTGNLDSHTAIEILETLDSLSSEGRTIVVITHDPTVAKRAQRHFTIIDGNLSESTTERTIHA